VKLDTSIVQKLESLLLVAVPRDLTDSDVLALRREVLRQIRQHMSRWVLLDFSRVDICDSFFGRFIQSTAHMSELMGAQVIVCGLQDAVVETMVGLGMILPNIHAVLDLDDALALSRESDAKSKTRVIHTEMFTDLEEVDSSNPLSGGENSDPFSDLTSPFSEV
jgi:rsbT antagonist protein RsbS